MAKRLGSCVLMLALLLGWSGFALAQDAKLYELTENAKWIGTGPNEHRVATSQMMGVANLGSALCPRELVADLEAKGIVLPGSTACTVNATGSDDISLFTGLGTFKGTFTIVVQGDNPVDSPELVVASGKFRGDMDFSPAVLGGVPYGTVKGFMKFDDNGEGNHSDRRVPFTGTFFLPFVIDASGVAYYLDFGNPMGIVPVRENEKGLGYPTVKFEIKF